MGQMNGKIPNLKNLNPPGMIGNEDDGSNRVFWKGRPVNILSVKEKTEALRWVYEDMEKDAAFHEENPLSMAPLYAINFASVEVIPKSNAMVAEILATRYAYLKARQNGAFM